MQSRQSAIGMLAAVSASLALLAAQPSRAQQFSADVVQVPAKGSTTTKLYVDKGKLRFQQLENGQPAGGAIIDADQKTTTIIDDQDHKYFGGSDSPLVNGILNNSGVPPIWRFFRPSNAAEPCTEWNAMMQAAARFDSTRTAPQMSCKSLGTDAVDGRPAEKWQVDVTRDNKTESGYAWIDNSLHVVSKSQDSTGSVELRNVHEGPQPDSVFQVPANYSKVDVNALLSKMKGGDSAGAAGAGLLGALGSSAKNGAVEGAKEGTAEAAKQKTKKKLGKILHIP